MVAVEEVVRGWPEVAGWSDAVGEEADEEDALDLRDMVDCAAEWGVRISGMDTL